IKDKNAYISGPSEFIEYIKSSNLFLTDSFHGAVFSILFRKPFIVFDREGSSHSMNSRIDTLLATFKLESRKFENISKGEDFINVDYTHIDKILESERQKAIDYLLTAFDEKV